MSAKRETLEKQNRSRGSGWARIARALRSNKAHRRYLVLLSMMAVVVALGVASSLTLSGVAATHEEQVLDCHYSGTAAHTHTDVCYDANGTLICPLEERELHVHDDSCYQTVLTCGLEESEGHSHTDA